MCPGAPFSLVITRMKTPLTNDRTRSAIELVVVLVLAEIWLWIGASAAIYRALAVAAIAIVVLKNVLRSNSDAWNTGRPLWSAQKSWIIVIAATCVLGAVAILGAELLYVEGETWRLAGSSGFLN